jgi:hypothetical protein
MVPRQHGSPAPPQETHTPLCARVNGAVQPSVPGQADWPKSPQAPLRQPVEAHTPAPVHAWPEATQVLLPESQQPLDAHTPPSQQLWPAPPQLTQSPAALQASPGAVQKSLLPPPPEQHFLVAPPQLPQLPDEHIPVLGPQAPAAGTQTPPAQQAPVLLQAFCAQHGFPSPPQLDGAPARHTIDAVTVSSPEATH